MESEEQILKDLKVKVQEGKVIIGTERVLKAIKGNAAVKKVFMTRNCPAKVKNDLKYYAGLAGIPLTELSFTNEELGIFCKKNFFISVLGITSE